MSYNDFYWGPLINPDKSAAPLLEQLCLGIAQIATTFQECGTVDLTPERLAAFYHKVGGNYDTLFLETKPTALSFIYQSLGCYHSLQQPPNNPFEPPSLPALLPTGFVRWQTIQILLDPDEHSEYLRRAVKVWDIRNPYGGYFPKSIPREAFPSEPDPEMVEWHEQVSRRLEYDYMKRNTPRASPPNFGHYQYHYLPKHARPKENKERSLARTKHRTAPVFRYIEPDDAPLGGPRKGSGAEQPHSSHHKASLRNDDRKPQAPTPPPSLWPDRAAGRQDRPSSFAAALGPETMPGYFPSDPSSEGSPSPEPPPVGHRYGRRNVSPRRPTRSRARSHEAYARRPARDISPDYRRYPQDDHASPGRWYDSEDPPTRYRDDLHPPKQPYTFDGPNGPVDPDSPLCFHVPQNANGSSSRYTSRPRKKSVDPHVVDRRRRSYSGGNLERSVPGQGGNPRSRWPNSMQGSKKFASGAMPEEYGRRGYGR